MHRQGIRSQSRTRGPILSLAALVLGAVAGTAEAGDLAIAWAPIDTSAVGGYRVYLGTEPGAYTRVTDAGEATRITIDGLEDERMHYLAVRAYDREGRDLVGTTAELRSLPAPRVKSIEPGYLPRGQSATVVLHGSNISPEAGVRARDPRIRVRSTYSSGPGELVMLVEAIPDDADGSPGPIAIDPGSFLVVNPGRKAEEYFDAHPEVIDLSGDGLVDDDDLAILRGAFGSTPGDSRYGTLLDLDGDGLIDGQDLSRLICRLDREGQQGTEP